MMDEPVLNSSYLNPLIQDFVDNKAPNYEEIIKTYLDVLRNLKQNRSLSEYSEQVCTRIENMLLEEKNSWSLAYALFHSNLLTREGIAEDNLCDDQDVSTEAEIIGQFYMQNSDIRRMQVIVDWLESNESNDLDERDEGLSAFYSESTTPWENTLHILKNRYHNDSITELCPQMDPDAPMRTKKPLDNMDKEDEYKFFKHVFKLLRAGKLDEGHEIAQRVGYHWLSALLDGWLLYSDPNLVHTIDDYDDELKPIAGNPKRKIWKQTCYKASQVHGLPSYEKAIFGFLGANLKSVLPVCHRWSDQLWSRLKCSIDILIERKLESERCDGPPFPDDFYSNHQDIEVIFKSIDNQRLSYLSDEEILHHTVQKYLMLNDTDSLLSQLESWCTDESDDNQIDSLKPHFARFFAHIVLMLRELSLIDDDEPRGCKVLEKYIERLAKMNLLDTVIHYTVLLPKENQTSACAKILAALSDRNKREHMLKLIKEAQLDIDEIIRAVVEQVRDEDKFEQLQVPEENELQVVTSEKDQRKLDAFDYLLYPSKKNYLALLHLGNSLMRLFALQKKIDAIRTISSRLPKDLEKLVETQWRQSTDKNLTPDLILSFSENRFYQILIDFHNKISLWSGTLRTKPCEPKKPAKLTNFRSTVDYEHTLKEYQLCLAQWNELYANQTEDLAKVLKELLLFKLVVVDDSQQNSGQHLNQSGGDRSNSTESVLRSHHDKIRRIYIPQCAFIYLRVMRINDRLDDCLELVNLIAGEDLQLYSLFTKKQMRDFLDKVREVKIAVCKNQHQNQQHSK